MKSRKKSKGMSLQTFVEILILTVLGLVILLLIESGWALLWYKIASALSSDFLGWWTTNRPIQLFLRFLPLEAIGVLSIFLLYKYKKSSSTRKVLDNLIKLLKAMWLSWLMKRGYKYFSRFMRKRQGDEKRWHSL